MFRHLVPDLRRASLETRKPMSLADIMEEFWRMPFEPLSTRREERALGFPSLDVSETPEAIAVTAEVPGVEAGDLDVAIENGVLTIKGEKKFEEEKQDANYHRIERSYGAFHRAVKLPAPVDENAVQATFKNGVLTLTLPKSQPATARKITIEG